MMAVGGEVEGKKNLEGLHVTAVWTRPEGCKHWQRAIWNDQVIGDDMNTKSPDPGNKPKWYRRAEQEPDLICQWVALVLTAS